MTNSYGFRSFPTLELVAISRTGNIGGRTYPRILVTSQIKMAFLPAPNTLYDPEGTKLIIATMNVVRTPRLRALVFDVDGTLYRQSIVRLRMAMRLAYRTLLHPRDMATVWRVLAAYRRAQETLRGVCPDCSNIAEEQIRIACRSTGVSQAAVACHVAEWIENTPLDLLSSAMYDGLREALRTAKQNGLKLAVWSDYPAVAKLQAMGVASFFNVVVSAHDSEVQRFKPDPRGLEVVLRRLGVSRDQAIYIGDRPEVDGQAAAHIGIKCFIIGKRATCGPEPPHWNYLADYGELNQFIRAASQQDSSVRS